MLEQINPGQAIHVSIVKQPTNQAAVKTLSRVLGKDPAARAEQKRQRSIRDRKLRHEQRGGRQWAVRVVKQPSVRGERGESGTVQATASVIADLKSVQRFIEVKPA